MATSDRETMLKSIISVPTALLSIVLLLVACPEIYAQVANPNLVSTRIETTPASVSSNISNSSQVLAAADAIVNGGLGSNQPQASNLVNAIADDIEMGKAKKATKSTQSATKQKQQQPSADLSQANNSNSSASLDNGASANSTATANGKTSKKQQKLEQLKIKELTDPKLEAQADDDGWLSPLSIEDFKKSKYYVPFWNETQEPLPMEKRQKLVQTYRDGFKMLRDIVKDSHHSMKLVFSAKILGYYSPKLTSIALRHKFMEWRLGVTHGSAFYQMVLGMLRTILDKSKTINYNRFQINLEELEKREHRIIDYLEGILKASPVLENLSFKDMKPPNLDAYEEAANTFAMIRGAGHQPLIRLIESSQSLTNLMASKEARPTFDELPAVEQVPELSKSASSPALGL